MCEALLKIAHRSAAPGVPLAKRLAHTRGWRRGRRCIGSLAQPCTLSGVLRWNLPDKQPEGERQSEQRISTMIAGVACRRSRLAVGTTPSLATMVHLQAQSACEPITPLRVPAAVRIVSLAWPFWRPNLETWGTSLLSSDKPRSTRRSWSFTNLPLGSYRIAT